MKKQNVVARNLTRFVTLAVAVTSLLLCEPVNVRGYGNHLDYSFDDDGMVESLGGASSPDVAIQSDDKIVIVSGAQGNFFLTRLNADGTLDTTFAGDGTLSIDFGGTDNATSVVIQSDGKIIVAGYSSGNYAVARVNPSGILDLGFSGDGRAIFDFQTGVDLARAVALAPGGKIVVVGSVDSELGFGVLQLNSDGSPDTSFSGDGKVITDIGGQETAEDVIVRFDGKIVVCGTTRLFGSTHDDFALLRYNANGTLDTNFDGDGRLTTDFDGLDNRVFAMKQTPSGTLVVVGHSRSSAGGNSGITVARYSQSGSLDPSFNGVGWAYYNLYTNGGEHAYDVAVNISGDITLAGQIQRVSAGHDLLLMRLKGDGRPDPKFGTGGRVTTVIGSDFSLGGYGIAVQQSGKIVVAGAATNLPTQITSTFATRYKLDGPAYPGDMTGDAQADYALFRPSTGVNWVLDSKTGSNSAYRFGATGDAPVPGDYDRDGKTDIAVFRGGTWYVLRSSDLSYFAASFGLAGDKPTQGDFDGDGHCDLAVFRPSSGVWYILSSLSNGATSFQLGSEEDKPVQADYDGDGICDVAVFRPSNGVWYILQSKFGLTTRQWGFATVRPVPADFDGDGRADIAYWSDSTGTGHWSSKASQTGNTVSVEFGSLGDIPAPADFDLDGKADPTVFRPSTGYWYVQKSNGGYNIVPFGASGDIPLWNSYTAQ